MPGQEVVEINPFGSDHRRPSRRRLLRILGPIGFVLVVLAALLCITAYSYYSNRRDALTLSEDVLGAIERRIARELEIFLIPVEDTVNLIADVLQNTSYDPKNRTMLEPMAFRVLFNLPQISNFLVADPDGNFLMVKAMPDGSFHTKIVDRSQNPTQVTWIRRDKDGNEVDVETSVDDSYDARKRPWYKGAVEAKMETGEVYWSDFYVFFADQKHGITISRSISGPENQLLGVFGLDMALEKISEFLETLKIGQRGRAFIVDEEGNMVAHPEIEKMVKKEGDVYKIIRLEELQDRVLRRAYSHFQIKGHGHRTLIVDDQRYLTTAFLLPTKIGHDLTVFIIVPEEDFVGFVARNNRAALLMSIGVVVVAAIMAGLMAFQSLRADRNAQLVLERQNELEAQSRAYSELSSQAALFDSADSESFNQLTEIVTKAAGIRRTSVWHFDDDINSLRCINCYDLESDGHTRETVLTKLDFPHLFEVLQKGAEIRTTDAGRDDRLSELYPVYMQPLGCESLLVAPVRHRDEIVGSLWFENDRMSGGWSTEEISFANAIANMLALRFSVDQRSGPVSIEPQSDRPTTAKSDDESTELPGKKPQRQPESYPRKTDTPREFRASVSAARPDHSRAPARRAFSGSLDPDVVGAQLFSDATVLLLRFTDPLSLAERMDGSESHTTVDEVVSHLEDLATSLGIEYVRIMGDEIICAAGIEDKLEDHSDLIADLALGVQDRCTGVFA
ncbi:MAG: GAF domain-containing protein, partial [Deltaproteobacteria bacterium]|nr:GAF domain-containing protein [Deltaproteobacteria bacterium]